jgi:hypothetical protein
VSLLHGSCCPWPLFPLRFCSLHHFVLPVCSPSGDLQFIQHYRVNAVKCAKKWLPILTFTIVCSVLLHAIHNRGPPRHFPHFSQCRQSSQCDWVFYMLVALQKLLLGIRSWWHDIKMLVSVSSMSEILVLGRPLSWCTLNFTAPFVFPTNSH